MFRNPVRHSYDDYLIFLISYRIRFGKSERVRLYAYHTRYIIVNCLLWATHRKRSTTKYRLRWQCEHKRVGVLYMHLGSLSPPPGFWAVWEGPPYRPHSLGDGSKCHRGKGFKTICIAPTRTSVRISKLDSFISNR